MTTHWSNSSAWRGYDAWRTGINDPHLDPPDDCQDCGCEDDDTCECMCHEDPRDTFVEP